MGKVTLDLVSFERKASGAAEAGLRAALGEAEKILKGDLLNRSGTGRIHKRGGVTHQASAPGQPPAPDTGSLRANTNADPVLKQDGDDITGRVVANSEHAAWLERGTEKMAARPYLSTLRDEHDAALQRAFTAGAKEGG